MEDGSDAFAFLAWTAQRRCTMYEDTPTIDLRQVEPALPLGTTSLHFFMSRVKGDSPRLKAQRAEREYSTSIILYDDVELQVPGYQLPVTVQADSYWATPEYSEGTSTVPGTGTAQSLRAHGAVHTKLYKLYIDMHVYSI